MNEDEFNDLFKQAEENEAAENTGQDDISDDDLMALLQDTLGDVDDLINGRVSSASSDDVDDDVIMSVDDDVPDDLIQIDDDEEPAAQETPVATPSPAPAQASAPADDLMADFNLDFSEEAPAPTATTPPAGAGSTDIPVTEDELDDILAGLGVDMGASSPAPAPAATTTPQPVQSGNIDVDLQAFDDVESKIMNAEQDGSLSKISKERFRQREIKMQGVRNTPRLHRFGGKQLALLLALLIILVPAVGYGIYLIVVPARERIYINPWDRQDNIYISHGNLGANNANFTFVSEERRVDNSRFYMSRMLLDHIATVFYFDEEIDWSNYYLELVDDMDNVYPVSLSYRENNIVRDYLAFEPLDVNARGVQLTITDKVTGSEAIFPLIFESTMVRLPVFYMNTASTSQFGETSMTILSARFSSFLSSIYFYMDITQGNLTFDDVFIVQGATRLPLINSETFELGNEYIIGRLDFAPLPVVNGNVNVMFTNAFNVYDINENFSTAGLFRNTPQDQVIIPVGGNQIVLERMGRMSEQFILILHGTDIMGDRRETRLDATFNLTQGNNTYSLEAITQSGANGTDMRFPMDGRIGANMNAAMLNIERAFIGGGDFEMEISLDGTAPSPGFFDEQLIGGASDFLRGMGYEYVEIVAYRPDDLTFSGIFRVANADGEVERYRVDSTRTDVSWDHVATKLN